MCFPEIRLCHTWKSQNWNFGKISGRVFRDSPILVKDEILLSIHRIGDSPPTWYHQNVVRKYNSKFLPPHHRHFCDGINALPIAQLSQSQISFKQISKAWKRGQYLGGGLDFIGSAVTVTKTIPGISNASVIKPAEEMDYFIFRISELKM